jgi:DNA-binding GntR family transcriptional regulator
MYTFVAQAQKNSALSAFDNASRRAHPNMKEPTSKTHATRTVIELRKKILGGELKGGTRLYEVPLAEELEISRTPLRDAMSRLAEEGLLERAQSGGFVVRQFSFPDVIDAIELRGVLEGTAARLAAERGATPEALAQYGRNRSGARCLFRRDAGRCRIRFLFRPECAVP